MQCWYPNGTKISLDERQRLIDEGKAEFIDWETAKEQIRARLRGD